MKDYICCICGKKFRGWGNNPWPVSKKDGDLCCDTCNATVVVPARISGMTKGKKERRSVKEHKEEAEQLKLPDIEDATK